MARTPLWGDDGQPRTPVDAGNSAGDLCEDAAPAHPARDPTGSRAILIPGRCGRFSVSSDLALTNRPHPSAVGASLRAGYFAPSSQAPRREIPSRPSARSEPRAAPDRCGPWPRRTRPTHFISWRVGTRNVRGFATGRTIGTGAYPETWGVGRPQTPTAPTRSGNSYARSSQGP